MARDQSRIGVWSQYFAARLAAMVLTMFDVDTNLRSAAAMGRALYRFDRRHRQRACRNIAMAFPDWDCGVVERVGRGSFEHFMQLAVEVCHTPRLLHLDSWPDRVRLVNLGPAVELLNARRGAILITGHLGNWEVLGYVLAVLGYDMDAIARPIDNPLINDWLMGIRQRQGMRIITKWDATDRMLQVIQRGGTLGFIADQNAGDKGLFVPFFGRLASTYKSIGLLAMGQRVPVICGGAQRVGPGFRYELTVMDIIHPEDWTGRREPLYYITARYCRAIENLVRSRPDQYLWMHRRWKSRPRHEREGKPVPGSLRRNLEDLPWMDQGQIQRLLRPAEPSEAA